MLSTDPPSISIVMALKNKESTVKRSLDSVLAQVWQDFELIIVDGSTDRSTEIVRSYYDRRIKLIEEEGGGVGAARNQGIALALADLVTFLDADDEYLPNFLETALSLKDRYPEADAFYQMFEVVEKDGKRVVSHLPPGWGEERDGLIGRYFFVISEGGAPMTTSSVAIRKNVLLSLGGFKKGVWYGEDTDLWGRIALDRRVAFSSNVGTIYHRDGPNRLSDRVEDPGENVLIPELEKALLEGRFGPHPPEDVQEYIAKLRFSSAYRALIAGDAKGARRMLSRAKTLRYRGERLKWQLWTLVPHKLFLWMHS